MWRAAETNTHQDHVIAHVIGATPLSYFIWDETVYLSWHESSPVVVTQ